MECIQIDLNNVCRTCKSEASEMKSLYCRDSESVKENRRLDEMLIACASIQIETEDSLPKLICQSCFVQLKNAYSFKEQCEKTDIFLRQYIQNLTKVNIKEEPPTVIDLEFTSDLTGEVNSTSGDKNSCENVVDNIKDDPDLQLEEAEEEDKDYEEVADNNSTVYECKICSKTFYTLISFRSHKRLHTGKIFKCKQCDKSYTKVNHLNRHILSHTKQKMYVCKICNKSLLRFEHFKQHLVTHLKEKPFSCPKCKRGFNRVERLQNHITCCKGRKVYDCDICNRTFLREDSLEVHKRIHENEVPVLATLENLNNIEEHYTEIDFGEAADVFSHQFDEEDAAAGEETIALEVSENHNQKKGNEIARVTHETCQADNSSEILLENVKIEEVLLRESRIDDTNVEGDAYESVDSAASEYQLIKQSLPKAKLARGRKATGPLKLKIKTELRKRIGHFECPECKLIFRKLCLLEKHAKQHGLKLYKCETCNKQFSKSGCLKRHSLSHVKPFVCVTCKKSFSRRDHLQNHMKWHLSADVFTCEMCREMFSREESLTKHKAFKHNSGEKLVVPERKFKCEYCPKAFTIERYRDSHMNSHLRDNTKSDSENAKMFLCSECGLSFKRHDSLVVHLKRHRGEKPFKCKVCGKCFTRTTDLLQHERYHTGEKMHLCVVCGRSFGRAYHLTLHMRTHTGEKPYLCTYCDASFAQRNDLKAHIRRHT